ncbi:MAG: baseplate J/gp47 family protein [Gemmatimonadaceae bacterium]
MPLPLPNLDTRRWADLVDEGRALIPRHAPQWTDHNAHDPGIMVVELMAWLIEQLIYRANRVPERHLRKFLALAGFSPRPPRPARAVLHVSLGPGAGSVTVPADTAWLAVAGDGRLLPFQALAATTLVESGLVAAQSFDGTRWADLGRAVRDTLPFEPFGRDPRVATPYVVDQAPALYLGLDRGIAAGDGISLYFHVQGSPDDERARLLAEAASVAAACGRPMRECTPCDRDPDAWCGDDGPPLPGGVPVPAGASPTGGQALSPHHAARVVWECLATDGWHLVQGTDVDDETRALTLGGTVTLRLPVATAATVTGAVAGPLHWLRCRLAAGSYDETPTLLGVTMNAVVVEQARTAWQQLPVAAGVVAGGAIGAGMRTGLSLVLDAGGTVTALAPAVAGAAAPELLVADYSPPTATTGGSLALDLVHLGTGTGFPEERHAAPVAPVADAALAAFTLEPPTAGTTWRPWSVRPDLDASGASDAHLTLDATTGDVRTGNGVRGRVVGRGAPLVARYRATGGAAGAVGAGRRWSLAVDALNTATVGAAFGALAAATTSNAFATTPGADEETVGQAAARAAASLWAHERLVELCPSGACGTLDQLEQASVRARRTPDRATTTLDFERIALDVPGTRVRRARAWAELDPAYAGMTVPGTVSVVVVPSLPAGRPTPSAGLLRAVRRYLDRRRVLCTRLAVVGPQYVEVRARAVVRTTVGADAARVREDVARALDRFLDPLVGGPAGRGWPFGRDVYRSEVLQVIDGVAGVDHVLALTLDDDRGGSSCANVCVPPTWLVAPGAHTVMTEPS